MPVSNPDKNFLYEQIDAWFKYILGSDNHNGYIYLAFKRPGAQVHGFEQRFYLWPSEADKAAQAVTAMYETHEVYYGMSQYSATSSKKDHVLGARCVWLDFDGNAPDPSSLPVEVPA